MLQKLGELLFIELVRACIEQKAEGLRGWLMGLRDRQIGASLQFIHRAPATDWTIGQLAREVGMSRSAFAERFSHYIGLSPMNYIVHWRMQLAAALLERPDFSVAQAAFQVGYQSEAAFRRGFKRITGTSPGEWRRRHAAA